MTAQNRLASNLLRKKPLQARSGATVEIIYEAATKIIEQEGSERLTTNRIAEIAGFSVGTLYQYFKDKNAVVLSMAIAERDVIIEELDRVFDAALVNGLDSTLAAATRVLFDRFVRRRRLRKAIIETALQTNSALNMREVMSVLETHLANRLGELSHVGGDKLSDSAKFVASRSLLCVLRSAVLENHPVLLSSEFESELLAMVRSVVVPES